MSREAPKYQIVETDLIDKISQGLYSDKNILPSEAELEKIYNCSRITIRQALENLEYKGYIYKVQGSGSFIRNKNMMQGSPSIKSTSQNLNDHSKPSSTKVLAFSIVKANKKNAEVLGVKKGDNIYYIERVIYLEDQPIIFEKSYMSVKMHPEISVKYLEDSKYKYAKNHNFNIEYSYQKVSPTFPTDDIADILKILPTQPILRVEMTTHLSDGTVFDYQKRYCNSELYQYNVIKRIENSDFHSLI